MRALPRRPAASPARRATPRRTGPKREVIRKPGDGRIRYEGVAPLDLAATTTSSQAMSRTRIHTPREEPAQIVPPVLEDLAPSHPRRCVASSATRTRPHGRMAWPRAPALKRRTGRSRPALTGGSVCDVVRHLQVPAPWRGQRFRAPKGPPHELQVARSAPRSRPRPRSMPGRQRWAGRSETPTGDAADGCSRIASSRLPRPTVRSRRSALRPSPSASARRQKTCRCYSAYVPRDRAAHGGSFGATSR